MTRCRSPRSALLVTATYEVLQPRLGRRPGAATARGSRLCAPRGSARDVRDGLQGRPAMLVPAPLQVRGLTYSLHSFEAAHRQVTNVIMQNLRRGRRCAAPYQVSRGGEGRRHRGRGGMVPRPWVTDRPRAMSLSIKVLGSPGSPAPPANVSRGQWVHSHVIYKSLTEREFWFSECVLLCPFPQNLRPADRSLAS